MSVIVVDTGCANLASVDFALERLGAVRKITRNASDIASADRIILPGVGSAPHAMRAIKSAGLLQTLSALQQPVLGICLGMQLLFEDLHEGGEITAGLGLVSGKVKALETGALPCPHMGWNTLQIDRSTPFLDGISSGDYAYFVHSYAAPISDITLASTEYGQPFSAVIGQGHVFGAQFHPERSGFIGAKILENFLKVSL